MHAAADGVIDRFNGADADGTFSVVVGGGEVKLYGASAADTALRRWYTLAGLTRANVLTAWTYERGLYRVIPRQGSQPAPLVGHRLDGWIDGFRAGCPAGEVAGVGPDIGVEWLTATPVPGTGAEELPDAGELFAAVKDPTLDDLIRLALRALIIDGGWTFAKLARATGYTEKTVSWAVRLRRQAPVGLNLADKLVRAMGHRWTLGTRQVDMVISDETGPRVRPASGTRAGEVESHAPGDDRLLPATWLALQEVRLARARHLVDYRGPVAPNDAVALSAIPLRVGDLDLDVPVEQVEPFLAGLAARVLGRL